MHGSEAHNLINYNSLSGLGDTLPRFVSPAGYEAKYNYLTGAYLEIELQQDMDGDVAAMNKAIESGDIQQLSKELITIVPDGIGGALKYGDVSGLGAGMSPLAGAYLLMRSTDCVIFIPDSSNNDSGNTDFYYKGIPFKTISDVFNSASLTAITGTCTGNTDILIDCGDRSDPNNPYNDLNNPYYNQCHGGTAPTGGGTGTGTGTGTSSTTCTDPTTDVTIQLINSYAPKAQQGDVVSVNAINIIYAGLPAAGPYTACQQKVLDAIKKLNLTSVTGTPAAPKTPAGPLNPLAGSNTIYYVLGGAAVVALILFLTSKH